MIKSIGSESVLHKAETVETASGGELGDGEGQTRQSPSEVNWARWPW